ncbi:hypothetical protein [Vitreimonas flagellata]|nr:hypothetical protein [Vitreimonas flagellata]
MINQVILTGILVNDPKTRRIEHGGASHDIVSLWLEAPSGHKRLAPRL